MSREAWRRTAPGRAQRDLRSVAFLAQVGKDDGFRLSARSVQNPREELRGLVVREVAIDWILVFSDRGRLERSSMRIS